MLIQQIKKDLLQARKEGLTTTVSALRTVLGELDRLPDKGSEDSVVSVLRKYVKNLQEMAVHANSAKEAEVNVEIAVISQYLPPEMTDVDYTIVYNSGQLDGGFPNMGAYMKACKEFAEAEGKTFDGILLLGFTFIHRRGIMVLH